MRATSSSSQWQTHSCALISSQPPKLSISSVGSTIANSASSAGSSLIVLPSSAAAVATPHTSTDFTLLSNVGHEHLASHWQSIDFRAETQLSRDEWVAVINMEIISVHSSGAAAAASPAVVEPPASSQPALSSSAPPGARVLDLGRWSIGADIWSDETERRGFKELTIDGLRLLGATLDSSPNLTALNLSGNNLREKLSDIAEPLGKLTVLQTLDLRGAVLLFFCCVLRELRGGMVGGMGRGVCL